MTTMNFSTDRPGLDSLDYGEEGQRNALARQLEAIMHRPEYWDRNSPMHHRAQEEARARFELLYGDAPTASASGGSLVFNTATGETVAPPAWLGAQQQVTTQLGGVTMATGEGTPDEYAFRADQP